MGSRTYYILGTDSRLFQNVAVQDARQNTDHYLVMGYLLGAALNTHLNYFGKRTRFPTRPPETLDGIDRMCSELRRAITRPPWKELHFQAWILPETWSLIDTRIEARRQKDQRRSWDLSRTIKAGIQEEMHIWADVAGSKVESLLASELPLIQEAWIRIQG